MILELYEKNRNGQARTSICVYFLWSGEPLDALDMMRMVGIRSIYHLLHYLFLHIDTLGFRRAIIAKQ